VPTPDAGNTPVIPAAREAQAGDPTNPTEITTAFALRAFAEECLHVGAESLSRLVVGVEHVAARIEGANCNAVCPHRFPEGWLMT